MLRTLLGAAAAASLCAGALAACGEGGTHGYADTSGIGHRQVRQPGHLGGRGPFEIGR